MVWEIIAGFFAFLINSITSVLSSVLNGLNTIWNFLPHQIRVVLGLIILFSVAWFFDYLLEITLSAINFMFQLLGHESVQISPVLFGIDLRFPYNCFGQICYVGFFKGLAIIFILFYLILLALKLEK